MLHLHDTAVLKQLGAMVERSAAPAKLLLAFITDLNFHLFRVGSVADGVLVPHVAILCGCPDAGQVWVYHPVHAQPAAHPLDGACERLYIHIVRARELSDLHQVAFECRCNDTEHLVFLGEVNVVIGEDDTGLDDQIQRCGCRSSSIIGCSIEFSDDHGVDIAVENGNGAVLHDALLVALRGKDVEARSFKRGVVLNERARILHVAYR